MKRSTLPIVFAALAFVTGSSVAIESTEPIAESNLVFEEVQQQKKPVAKGAQLVRPPAGRLAIVADGNSPDPDDIGAMAVMFGLLKASDLRERLVHLSHSCDLKPTTRIPADDELRRQKILGQICREGIAEFGPFKNLSAWFNCRTQQEEAVDNLRNAINKSSKNDPLWIIEAGEPDVIGYALKAADASKRGYVHVVSHHPANDNAGDFFSWQQILDYGVKEHQIGDQDVGLKTETTAWDWAKDHRDPRMKWIWKHLKPNRMAWLVFKPTISIAQTPAWFTGGSRAPATAGTIVPRRSKSPRCCNGFTAPAIEVNQNNLFRHISK